MRLPEAPESPLSQLSKWVEAGYNNQAIAANGTTIDVLKQILLKGIIPSAPAERLNLPYQQEITDQGKKCLYYATPILDNLKNSHPVFAHEIIAGAQSSGYYTQKDSLIQANTRRALRGELPLVIEEVLPLQTPFRLELDDVKETSRFYAQMQSMENIFKQLTGIFSVDLDDIIIATKKTWPKSFAAFARHCEFDRLQCKHEENSSPANVALLCDFFDQHPEIKPDWLKSNGVIIYFNSDLFSLGSPLLGHEDETEIMITSDQPIPASAISGIELGKRDLKLIKSLI